MLLCFVTYFQSYYLNLSMLWNNNDQEYSHYRNFIQGNWIFSIEWFYIRLWRICTNIFIILIFKIKNWYNCTWVRQTPTVRRSNGLLILTSDPPVSRTQTDRFEIVWLWLVPAPEWPSKGVYPPAFQARSTNVGIEETCKYLQNHIYSLQLINKLETSFFSHSKVIEFIIISLGSMYRKLCIFTTYGYNCVNFSIMKGIRMKPSAGSFLYKLFLLTPLYV